MHELRWNNPKLHTPDRRKVWLACDEHRESLSQFLAARNFLREVAPHWITAQLLRSSPRLEARSTTSLSRLWRDIGRVGWRKDSSSIPWPGRLVIIARRHWSAIWASVLLPRSAARRSLSSRANRQLRTCPSAVSRTRSQSPQNGRVTDAMTPTLAGPPSTRNVSAGALPRCSGSGVRVNSCSREAKISAAVTIPWRDQLCWASRGICSMIRSW